MFDFFSSSNLCQNLSRLSDLQGCFYFWESSRLVSSPKDYSSFWEQEKLSDQGVLHWTDLSNSLSQASYFKLSDPIEAASLLSERKLWQTAPIVFVPDFFASGDYGGSIYGLANKEAFLEEFGDSEKIGGLQIWELLGGYGSSQIAVDPRYVTEELLEALESLQSYPVWDEDKLYKVEDRLKEEAFSCFLESDLRKRVEEILTEAGEEEEKAEEKAESLTEENLWEILYQADSDGSLWEPECNSMYCRLERITEENLREASVL
jgi:hypothetical protein